MASFADWSDEEWDQNEERAMAHVGRFLQYWACLEWEINDAIGKSLGLHHLQSAIVTSNTQFRDKIHMLRAALRLSNIGRQKKRHAALDKMLLKIAKRAAYRNLMAHSVFWGAEDKNGVEFWVVRAKGQLDAPEIVWREAKFGEQIDDLLDWRRELEAVNKNLRPLNLTAAEKLVRARPIAGPIQLEIAYLPDPPPQASRKSGKKISIRQKASRNRPSRLG